MRKRTETLQIGIRLVEIDYLHERRPLLADIPSYANRQPGAFPYHLIVSDPHPSADEGPTDIYSFGIFDPPPAIAIPLDDTDSIMVDFGLLYQRTFESSRLFREILVDYTQEAVNFASYSEADQQTIRERIAQIAVEQT
jgi:hypothetical protein